MWENEWKDNVTIASHHPKHYDVDKVFGFHQYECDPPDGHPNTLKS